MINSTPLHCDVSIGLWLTILPPFLQYSCCRFFSRARVDHHGTRGWGLGEYPTWIQMRAQEQAVVVTCQR